VRAEGEKVGDPAPKTARWVRVGALLAAPLAAKPALKSRPINGEKPPSGWEKIRRGGGGRSKQRPYAISTRVPPYRCVISAYSPTRSGSSGSYSTVTGWPTWNSFHWSMLTCSSCSRPSALPDEYP